MSDFKVTITIEDVNHNKKVNVAGWIEPHQYESFRVLAEKLFVEGRQKTADVYHRADQDDHVSLKDGEFTIEVW